ncbi:DNA cytosine methyltransferase [Chromobacterium haemolyticum]|uniref:DNA (cytosine-5-)-methyltransferase n=1 Tax=Chromobacterium fluminis TaxID=3044269 RepID=A0ABX0LFG2_9NEIS|nr:DNA cytosine methyltransferase [Chromobacterium haemolyticum]NHR08376.1 DNA cytosine methyltransferase [Chromobacterium haemolyticum]
MIRDQFLLGMDNEIIVDLFAGGGGMSTAIEQALGRHSDVSVNHDEDAVSMHTANHPQTEHYRADVFEVCPYEATRGRAIGLLHLSPDCTHHSQAAGGQPRDRKIRALAWVGKRWAGMGKRRAKGRHPRVITLENVKQILQWGPLVAKRCKHTGRAMKLDGTVAAPGERVPVHEQYLVPDPKRAGQTWRRFVRDLESLGYAVEWNTMISADYGDATTRERLFMCARRDGHPIVLPEPTHHKNPSKGQKAWRPAADHIDFTDLGQSIFNRKRPLAPATMRRIAKGMKKFVLDSANPFIVPIAHYNGSEPVHDITEPLRTITAHPKGGSFAVATPHLVKFRGDSIGHAIDEPCPTITSGGAAKRPAGAAHALGLAAATMVQLGYGERPGQAPRALDIHQPLGTVVAGGGKHGLTTAYLMQANGEFNTTPGHDPRKPSSTITSTGSQQQLVTAHLAHLRQNCDGRDLNEPLRTLSAGGEHHGLVTAHLTTLRQGCDGRSVNEPLPTVTAGADQIALTQYTLSKEHEEGALRCASFLVSYYGTDNMRGLDEPLATITTRDRLALVTVWIKGEPWVIVDICLRMLKPRELYGCQGFPASYIIDCGHDGRVFSKSAQVRMVGNSVSPGPARALIWANCSDMAAWTLAELKQRERVAA